MARNLNIPHKVPNDLLTADEFNILVQAAEDSVTSKLDLGLDQVSNTSDINKPISIATQAALNNKQNNLGFTPENPNNKVVDLLTPNHTTYPTSLAVSNAIFNSGVVVTDATSSVKGKIALTGDLGGTADAPTVPGLANKQDILPTGTTTQYLRGDKTLATLSTDVVAEGTTNKYLSSTERNKLNGIAAGATVNDSDVNLKNRLNHTGTQSADTITDGTTNKVVTAAEKTKLAGIATGATANSSDATLLNRANHSGTQSADTLIDGTTNKIYTATEQTKLAGVQAGATVNSSDVVLKDRANHTGTQSADTVIDGTTNKVFTTANQTKLNGIATAATANSTDATLRDRSTHTGTQPATSITEDATHRFTTDANITKLSGIATGATVNSTDASLRDRSTHTGTQAQSTITGLSTTLTAKADLVTGTVPLAQIPVIPLAKMESDDLGSKFNESIEVGGKLSFLNTMTVSGIDRLAKIWGSKKINEPLLVRAQDTVLSLVTTARTYLGWHYFEQAETVAYISFIQRTAGVYTAVADRNKVVIYSFDPTTKIATQVGISADTPNLFTAAAGAYVKTPLITPAVCPRGWYLIGFRYESSAQTTQPAIGGKTFGSSTVVQDAYTEINPYITLSGLVLPSTIDLTGVQSQAGGIMYLVIPERA